MRFLLLMVTLSVHLCSISQSSIRGFVRSHSESHALSGVVVKLKASDYQGVSDVNGFYTIDNVANGEYILVLSKEGYLSREKKIIAAGKIVQFDFELLSDFSSVGEIPLQLIGNVTVESTLASSSTPVAHFDLDKEDLNRVNSGQDLPYMLRFTPSMVTTSDAGNGIGYTGMRIRGSDASRINVTINDIPLNDAESQGVFWVNLPDFGSSVDAVQIQRGVGTSTNGAASFGGAVKLSTSDIPLDAGVVLRNTAGSFNSYRNTLELNSGLLDNQWAFQGRLSQISSDGYIDRASSNLKSYYLSGGYYGDKTSIKALVFGGHERTYQAWYGTPESRITGDEEAMMIHAMNNGYTPEQTENILSSGRTYNYYLYENEVDDYAQDHYQLHITHALSDQLTCKISTHYTYGRGYYEQFKAADNFENYGLLPLNVGGEVVESTDLVRRRWLQNDFYGVVGSLQWLGQKVEATLGGASHLYDGDHYGELIWMEFANQTQPGDTYYLNNGLKKDNNAYLRTQVIVKDGIKIYGDFQVRQVLYAVEGLDSDRRLLDTGDSLIFFNPKLGVFYQADSKWNFYASWAIGNHEPNRSDYIDALQGSFPKSESMQDLEWGARWKNDVFVWGVNFYNMNYKDQLVLTGALNDVGTPIRQNVANSYRRGVELELAWNPVSSLLWTAQATLSQSKISSFEETVNDYTNGFDIKVNTFGSTAISFSPSVVASSVLNYKVLNRDQNELNISWMMKYVGKQYLDNTSNSSRAMESYLVNDLKIAYQIFAEKIQELELSLFVNNFLNLEYVSNGYTYSYRYGELITENFYYPQARRNFLLGLTAKF